MKYPASLIRRPANTLARLSHKLLLFSIMALLISLPTPKDIHAAAGDLDLTFGNGGIVTTDFFGNIDAVLALTMQSDGKIIAAGIVDNPPASPDFALARYQADGNLDTSFGTSGRVTTDFFGFDDTASAVVCQPNGKIIAAGSAGISTGQAFVLVRYNTDGTLDSTFGSGGKVVTVFGRFDNARTVVLQTDGKIVAAGNTDGNFAIARYNTDGSLDSTFGSGGKVVTDFSVEGSAALTVAIQPDGKIIAAGQAFGLGADAIARYNTDGSLDISFGSGGKVVTIGGGVYAINFQPNGKIVAVGTPGSIVTITRYNPDGSLDLTFGTNGKKITDFFGSQSTTYAFAFQPNGKLVVGGATQSSNSSGSDFALARFNSDGNLDTSFGLGGKVTSDFTFGDRIRALAFQANGKIIAAGSVFNVDFTAFDFALVRYNSGASFDICMQDDSNGNLLQFNSTTGDYQFSNCRKGWSFAGRGTITVNSCKMKFIAADVNGSISALTNTCTNVGTASVQVNAQGRTFTISDRDMRNNSCGCQ